MTDLKRIALGLCLIATCAGTHAAKDSIAIGTLPDGKEVMAEKHFFGKRIEGFEPIPGQPQLCVRFVETQPPLRQELALYDVLKHRLIWITDVDFARDFYIPTSQGVILQSGKNTLLLGDEGAARWESKKLFPVYVDEQNNVVLGYSSRKSNELKAVSLRDGQDMWTATLPHKYGWREILPLDNGNLLISSDKICMLNPVKGEIKTADAENARQNTKKMILQSSAITIGGILGGMIGGAIVGSRMPYVYAVPAGPGYLYHLNSNFYLEDGRIYYADRRRLRCMDEEMNVIWEKELPKKASMSRIYIEEDTLFYENTGWGEDVNGELSNDTRAYSMRYDPRDGTELSEKEALEEQESIVTCFLKDTEGAHFTPLQMTVDEIKKQKKVSIYQIDRPLSSTLISIYNDTDYWIVDWEGKVYLHITQPLLQTEVMGNILVGLTTKNVIFQFDISALGID